MPDSPLLFSPIDEIVAEIAAGRLVIVAAFAAVVILRHEPIDVPASAEVVA